jgi:serine/threonine-protein kinase
MPITCHKGVVIAERYELVRQLGEGGMGEVWAAVHTVTRKPVALKFLKGSGRADERRRFLREARAASVVRHPAVVQVHDILEESGTPVLVMDLLTGVTLAQRLSERGSLSLGEVARILVPVVSAVGTAHSLGIIHRDLKPENIFLCDTVDGSLDVKVLDFGVAKLTATEGDAAQTAGLTRTGEILGTPYYMSPEQVFGEHDIDHRADIWSIGVILYECLAGVRPFEGDNVGQILKKVMMGGRALLERTAPGLPADVCLLVNRMLCNDRDARPKDLREVLDALRPYTDSSAPSFGTARSPIVIVVPAGDKTPVPTTDPFSRTSAADATASVRRPNRLAWAAVSLVVIGGVAAGAWQLARRTAPQPVAHNPPISAPDKPQSNIVPANLPSVAPANIPNNPPITPQNNPTANPQQNLPIATANPPPPPGKSDGKPHHHPAKAAKPAHAPSVAAPPDARKPPAKLPGGVDGDAPF